MAGRITGVTETRNIYKTAEGAEIRSENGAVAVGTDNLVSMNMWGLTPDFVETLRKGFVEFLQNEEGDPLTKEYLLPTFIDGLIRADKIKVDVLETGDEWFGVTYQEDKAAVTEAILALTKAGLYPA